MNWRKVFRRILMGLLSGIVAGFAAFLFLVSLQLITQIRQHNPTLIWLLPLGGLWIGWIYHRFGREAAAGSNLILDEIHDPRKIVPFSMAPLIWAGTLVTHLFGGSAGREGTVVQLGASLSDQWTRFIKTTAEERKALLAAGAGAGFGAAIGAPWAGMIFGMEVLQVGRLRLFASLECFVASFLAYGLTVFLNAPHSKFPAVEIPSFSVSLLVVVLISGVLFGGTARVFVQMAHLIEHFGSRCVKHPVWRPFVGGVLILALYHAEGSFRYAGLGIEWIQDSFQHSVSFREPALKAFFTAMTVGSGFKGGEFVPLVFVGATLGSALAAVFSISVSFLAALGFAAVFAGASNTPLACSLMAMELFGASIAPYALLICFCSYYFSGHKGIYKSQKIFVEKHKAILKPVQFILNRHQK